LLRGQRARRENGHDDIDFQTDHLGSECGKSIELSFRQSDIEDQVLPFNEAGFAQLLTQLLAEGFGVRIAQEEPTDPAHPCLLLCARRERPYRRAANQRYELTSLQLTELHSLPHQETAAAYRIDQD
jgi:hypothetical protein